MKSKLSWISLTRTRSGFSRWRKLQSAKLLDGSVVIFIKTMNINIKPVLVSLSHTQNYAAATAILEGWILWSWRRTIDMKNLFRKFLLTVTISGGFLGFLGVVEEVFQLKNISWPAYIISAGFAAVYFFILLSELLFADNPKCIKPMIIAFILQVPCISSPLVSWCLCC